MNVSWFTCRPNDRQKMPNYELASTTAVSEITPSADMTRIPKSTQMTFSDFAGVKAYYRLRVLLTRNG
jgi:hypothetical protein